MATATLASVPTVLNGCNDATDLGNFGGDTYAVNTSLQIEGAGCLEAANTTNGNNDNYAIGTWDLTNVHIRLNFLMTYVGDLAASNAIQVFLYDGSNYSYWYWTKWSAYTGGWANPIIYTGTTPDIDNSINLATITQVGLRFVTSSKPRNVPWNVLFDQFIYGDGYIITGGTSGDELTWDDIVTADVASAYGVVTKLDGVFFLTGDIQFGDGALATWFRPEGQLAVFKDEQVLSTLYKISAVDDSSALTNIDVIGGAWASAGTLRYDLDFSDADINSLSIVGVQISGGGYTTLHTGAVMTNCVFDNCAQIDPGLATFQFHIIKNYADDGPSSGATEAALLWPTNDVNCSDHTFTDNTVSVEYDTNSDATPVFHNMLFDDNSGWYDVLNTSGDSATDISMTGTSNANSYIGDYTTFTADQITHTLSNLVNTSEVTYMKRGAAVDTGSDGSTTVGSRNFVTTNSWTPDAYKGHLLYITSGADAGRYYCSGNSATTLYLDAEMTATAGTLDWELYDENDDIEVFHVESVTGNQSQYIYTYASDVSVDIYIVHVDYEVITTVDVTLGNSSQTIPQDQQADANYLNP